MKRPAFQFYPGDWLRDAKLRACSVAARGLWIELLCRMYDLEPYGHLAINGNAIPDQDAAGMCGVPVSLYRKLITELEVKGVASRTPEGVLYNRRMVRDAEISSLRSVAGARGGIARQLLDDLHKQKHVQMVAVADAVAVTPRRGIPKGETPEGFTQAWEAYPKRPNNSRQRALRAYVARMVEGCDPVAILDGVKRYAAYCRLQRIESMYIKQAATFFGPDRHWESDYSSPAPKPNGAAVEYPRYKPPDRGRGGPPTPLSELVPRLGIVRDTGAA